MDRIESERHLARDSKRLRVGAVFSLRLQIISGFKMETENSKIEIFSEQTTVFVHFVAMSQLMLIALKIGEKITDAWPWGTSKCFIFAEVGLLKLFLFSYRKQTQYVGTTMYKERADEGARVNYVRFF